MTLVNKMVRAAKLDPSLYEKVESDPSAMGEAMTVVAISAVAAGVGAIRGGVLPALVAFIGAFVGWYIWAWLTFLIGTKMLPEPQTKADLGELLRTLGFAASPGVLRAAAIVPVIGSLIAFLASIWMLVAMVVAVRQALDYTSTGRALGVCAIGFVIYLVFSLFLALAVGGAAALGGAAFG